MFKDLLDKFKQNNILVIGDLMLDEYINVHSTSIKEQRLKTSINSNKYVYCLGGAGNVMSNLNVLGSNNYFCAVHGVIDNPFLFCKTNDLFKQLSDDRHKRVYRNYKLDPDLDVYYRFQNSRFCLSNNILINDHSKYKLVVKTRYLNDETDELEYRVDTENDPEFKFEDDYLEAVAQTDLNFFFNKFDSNKAVIFSDYNKGFIKKSLIKPIKKRLDDCFVAVDPHPNNEFDLISYLDKIDLLKINREEFEKFLEKHEKLYNLFTNLKIAIACNDEINDITLEDFKTLIKTYIYTVNPNIHYFILTLSSYGMILYNNKTDEIYHNNSFYMDTTINNTNGCGDSVIALLTNIAMNEELNEKHLDIANLGAKTVINKKVTVPIDIEYLLSVF